MSFVQPTSKKNVYYRACRQKKRDRANASCDGQKSVSVIFSFLQDTCLPSPDQKKYAIFNKFLKYILSPRNEKVDPYILLERAGYKIVDYERDRAAYAANPPIPETTVDRFLSGGNMDDANFKREQRKLRRGYDDDTIIESLEQLFFEEEPIYLTTHSEYCEARTENDHEVETLAPVTETLSVSRPVSQEIDYDLALSRISLETAAVRSEVSRSTESTTVESLDFQVEDSACSIVTAVLKRELGLRSKFPILDIRQPTGWCRDAKRPGVRKEVGIRMTPSFYARYARLFHDVFSWQFGYAGKVVQQIFDDPQDIYELCGLQVMLHKNHVLISLHYPDAGVT